MSIGTTVFNPQSATFSVRPGPINANVVLADEINRTPPKTQAALLEAMEEARVTIDGTPIALPQPFIVCATQNPIEYEGTYPLPEAQLDRFTVKISTGYPAPEQELDLLERVAAGFDSRALELAGITAVTDAQESRRASRGPPRARCDRKCERMRTRLRPQRARIRSSRSALRRARRSRCWSPRKLRPRSTGATTRRPTISKTWPKRCLRIA